MDTPQKAIFYYEQAFDNIKNHIDRNFTYLSETGQEKFLLSLESRIYAYYSFAYRQATRENDAQNLAFNNTLTLKNLLLREANQLQKEAKNSKNETQSRILQQLIETKRRIAYQYSNPVESRNSNMDSLENMAAQLEDSLALNFTFCQDFL